MSALPSPVGLPQEYMLGNLDYSIPPDAKSFSVKIQPSNQSTVTSPTYTISTTCDAYNGEQPFKSQQIIFDLPCGASPSQFLVTRFTTLNFNATIAVTNAARKSKYIPQVKRCRKQGDAANRAKIPQIKRCRKQGDAASISEDRVIPQL